MKAALFAIALSVISCHSVPEGGTPAPSEPMDLATVPKYVTMATPFRLRHCGIPKYARTRVLLDGKWVLGHMLWDGECKVMDYPGLTRAGVRWLTFEVDGEELPERYYMRVLD